MNPGMLEILCAREERRMMDRIGEAAHRYCEARPFPQFAVCGDIRGALYSSTIIDQSLALIVSGRTALGNLIHVEIEVVHDDTWIPVAVISSTELEESLFIVMRRHDDDAFAEVLETLDQLVAAATARVKFERDNLSVLLRGRTSFTIDH